MESLKNLVDSRGTTICSVIHQPRKFIYELFDSLILLGVSPLINVGHVFQQCDLRHNSFQLNSAAFLTFFHVESSVVKWFTTDQSVKLVRRGV